MTNSFNSLAKLLLAYAMTKVTAKYNFAGACNIMKSIFFSCVPNLRRALAVLKLN